MTHSMEGMEDGGVWEEGRAGFLILRRVETFPNKRCLRITRWRCDTQRRPSISGWMWGGLVERGNN